MNSRLSRFGMLILLMLAVVVAGAAPASAAITVDANVFADQGSAKSSVTSPAFSTTSANELVLAFIATDYLGGANTTVTSVVGGGLTWTLVARTNVQSGTSEIWRAFAASPVTAATVTASLSQNVGSSLVVMSFSGVNTSGINGAGAIGATKSASAGSGAPTASLITTSNGSWVFAVGNDFDNAISRKAGTNQTVTHQYLTPSGDTYWVQMQNAATPLGGTSVVMNDTAPTGDRYNLTLCEIISAGGGSPTFTLSGSVTPSANGSGVTMALSGAATASTSTNASGAYSFGSLANGAYTVTPSKAGYTFSPSSLPETVNGSNISNANFTITANPTFSISGTISPAASGNGAMVTLSGAASASTTADSNGNYSFSNLANGSYTVTPAKSGFTFTPANQPVIVNGANISGENFTAVSTVTWSISGTISPAASGNGATVTLSGAASASTTADSNGKYSFSNLANGSYTVTPAKAGFTFTPANQPVTVNGANVSGENFTAASTATWSIAGVLSPAAAGSAATVTLGGAAAATTTADSSGNYSFTSLANGVYSVTPSKSGYSFTPSNQAVTINGSSNSGVNFVGQVSTGVGVLAIDAQVSNDSSKSAPTIQSPPFSTASGNELLLAFVATDYLSGTNTTVTGVTGAGLTWTLVVRTNVQSGSAEIWRAFAATAVSNSTITANLSSSVLASITVMSYTGVDTTGLNGAGAIGAIKSANAKSGAPAATLVSTRNNSWVFGVGNDFDNAISRTASTGQSVIHEDLTSTGDTYWVQMQNGVTSGVGTSVPISDIAPNGDRYNLSVVEVLPSSGGGNATPPVVAMNAPAPNATVTGKTTVSATATDTSYAITGVQFLLDGSSLGAQVASSPYSLTWDTTTVAAGSHTLSAIAYDSDGLNATATNISITVDNSGNAAVVGSWSSPIALPTVAVNLVLLKNNKLLFYEDGNSPTVWDYTTNVFTNVPTGADLFCSGHALLSDGRVLVIGGYGAGTGNIGIPNAEIFDPSKNSWTSVPKMAYSRWYPTGTPLSDGRILVTAGWQTTNHSNAGIPEIYDSVANTWTSLKNANNPFETYPFMFMLSDGRIIHTGGSEYATNTDILDINAQTWTVVDSRIVDGGSANMFQPGKIVKAGSASDSQSSGPSSNTTFVLDTTQTNPTWQQTPSMAYARSFMNLTELPDGTVLATGGESDRNGGDISKAVYTAELWSPTSQTWTTMSAMHTPREYHSTALLLPDGRVLQSGMGADFGNVPDEMSAEFYSPPYLFKGARPSITQSPAQVSYGASFFVGTPDGATISSAVLIRTGAVTHFFDQNTRFVPVSIQQTAGGLNLTAPANAYLAPPGYYMLFLVNSNGVPSIAPFVQLTP